MPKTCTESNTHTYIEKWKESVSSTHHMGIKKHCGDFYVMIRNVFMDDSSIQMNMYIIKSSAPNSYISLVIVYISKQVKKNFETWRFFETK